MGHSTSRPKPHDVFTPASPPLKEHNVYASRLKAESALRRYIERNQIPVVWGEYGVGKTTLVRRFFRPEEDEGRLIYVASVAGMSLSDVFTVILEHLNFTVEAESSSTESFGGDGGFDLKILKASAKGEYIDTRTSRLVVTSPTDTTVNRLIREARLTVVLDEMHRASREMRSALADWIKATRATPGEFGLVLVGTSTDAGRLVALDHGIDRYIKEMPVDLMTDTEARYIVEEGFSRLGLTVQPELRDRLVRSAAGAPTIVQALCLDAAESAIHQERTKVLEIDLKNAVEVYLKENGGRLADYYYRAIETVGPKRYRKQILKAVASIASDYVTMEDIREAVSAAVGENVPSSSLSGPLKALKTLEYGAILKDVGRDVSGTRIHNLTTFSDPMMKSFVRFMNNLDETRLAPPSPSV